MGLTLANKLSIVRMLIVPVIAIGIYYYDPAYPWLRWLVIAVFLVGSITDALDGFLARRFGQKTPLGALLDPLADKLLLDVSFILLTVLRRFEPAIPHWVTIIVVARDVVLVLGAWYVNQFYDPLKISARPIGKLTTALQMVTVLGVLMEVSFVWVIWQVTACLTVVSLIDYLWSGSKIISPEQPSHLE